MSKSVSSYDAFAQKYGGSSHQLHGLGKPSIYSKSGHKKRKARRGRLPYAGEFGALPQARTYRGRVPAGFRHGGWYGDYERHAKARMGIKTGRKSYAPMRRGYTTYVSPSAVRQSKRFSGEEFDLNRRKFSPVRGVERGVGAVRRVPESYSRLREEAIASGAVPLPTSEDVGAGALKRDVNTGAFYLTRTGSAIKGTLDFLEKRKIKAEQAKKEKAYRIAQERAEQARLNRLEIQTELENRKLAELKGQSGTGEFAKQVVSEEDVKKAQEKNRGILGDFFKKKETEKVPVRLRETKKQVEQDYEGV